MSATEDDTFRMLSRPGLAEMAALYRNKFILTHGLARCGDRNDERQEFFNSYGWGVEEFFRARDKAWGIGVKAG